MYIYIYIYIYIFIYMYKFKAIKPQVGNAYKLKQN